jgi:hypothetical protein
VKALVEARVKLFVVVAFSAIVHPPVEESRVRLEKGEDPGVMVLPDAVAFIFTVPELWVKVPLAASKFPPMARMFDGLVTFPAWMVKLFVVVADAVVNVQAPFVPAKRRFEKEELPGNMVCPVEVAFIFTVPELWVKEPPLFV